MDEDWQARTKLIFGEKKSAKLFQSHVLVVGLGGVGGIAAEMIARAGISKMTIVDGDTFDATNRNRQIGALVSTCGLPKTDVMAARLKDVNPRIELKSLHGFLLEEDMKSLLISKSYDCVIDAIDSLSPKLALLETCVKNNIPVVSCMGSGARVNPELVRCVDISKTEHCGLARAVRHGLKKRGILSGIRVIFSPEDPPPGSVLACNDDDILHKRTITGTVSYMPAVFGCHCAAEAIRLILSADA